VAPASVSEGPFHRSLIRIYLRCYSPGAIAWVASPASRRSPIAEEKRTPEMAAAPSAPMICAITNAGTWLMAMPANVVVKPRARVTAGLAKDVEDVNQYAATITKPTSQGTL
jgi:hypothetical protein